MDAGKDVAWLKSHVGFEADGRPEAAEQDRPVVTVSRFNDEGVEGGFKPLTRGIADVPDLPL